MKTKIIAYKTTSLDHTPSTFVGKKIPEHKYSKFVITANNINMKYIFQYLYQTKLKFTQIKASTPYAIEKIKEKEKKSDKVTKIIYIPLENVENT